MLRRGIWRGAQPVEAPRPVLVYRSAQLSADLSLVPFLGRLAAVPPPVEILTDDDRTEEEAAQDGQEGSGATQAHERHEEEVGRDTHEADQAEADEPEKRGPEEQTETAHEAPGGRHGRRWSERSARDNGLSIGTRRAAAGTRDGAPAYSDVWRGRVRRRWRVSGRIRRRSFRRS
jgi:hypothetical protein